MKQCFLLRLPWSISSVRGSQWPNLHSLSTVMGARDLPHSSSFPNLNPNPLTMRRKPSNKKPLFPSLLRFIPILSFVLLSLSSSTSIPTQIIKQACQSSPSNSRAVVSAGAAVPVRLLVGTQVRQQRSPGRRDGYWTDSGGDDDAVFQFPSDLPADVTVCKSSGGCDYTTVPEAVNAAPDYRSRRFVDPHWGRGLWRDRQGPVREDELGVYRRRHGQDSDRGQARRADERGHGSTATVGVTGVGVMAKDSTIEISNWAC